MPDISDVISFSKAAEDLDCGRTTVYRATWDGRLNTVEVGGREMVLQDETYEEFEPNRRGLRARKDNEASNDSQ